MRKPFTLIILSAVALALPTTGFAAPKEKAAAEAKKPAEKAPAAAAETAKAAKPIPMHSRADSIDVAAKTFTTKHKDGVEVKHVITDKTEIKNGDAAAKLEDIKVGDFVSGLRQKTGENQFEVIKITKFGPAPEKKEKPAGEKPAEEKKAAEKKS